MEWKEDISENEDQTDTNTRIERSKVEAQRKIAEQLEQLNNKIEVFGNIAVELMKLNKNLENLNFNLVKG